MAAARAVMVSVRSVWKEGFSWGLEGVNWLAMGSEARRAVEMGLK